MQNDECPIASRAQDHPDAPAVWDGDGVHSFAAYHAAIMRMVRAIPIANQERVGICEPLSFGYLCLLHALLRQGGTVLPLSPRLPDAGMESVVARCGLSRVIRSEELDELARTAGAEGGAHTRSPCDASIVVLTSGSSAAPKAVVHSVASLLSNAHGANTNMPLGQGDRWLLSLPLYHVSGLGTVMRAALAGAAIVIPGTEDLADAIAARSVTHVSVVAMQLAPLLDAWERSGVPASLKGVLAGGSPIPADLIRRAHRMGVPLHVSYGCTEMGSQVTTTRAGASLDELLTSGRALAGRAIIMAKDGEILVRGACLCRGFLGQDGIRACTDAEGWYHTRDTGWMDEEGRLVVSGRRDRMFISGGENICPEEIEELLLQHGDIEAAAVVEVASADYGFRPVAFVRMAQERDLSSVGVRAFLAERVPGFKIPDALWEWPADYPAGGLKTDLVFLRERARELIEAATGLPAR